MLSKRDEKRRDLPDHCKMLWAALEARNWTEWELMMIFGCSRSRVSRLLNANATITASAALDFELALGIDPETLLRKQGEWLLSLVPPLSESDKARMRQRRETVEAKVQKRRLDEIESLLKEQDLISARLNELWQFKAQPETKPERAGANSE
jgi:plasmid maintenance system antidote protein VapI